MSPIDAETLTTQMLNENKKSVFDLIAVVEDVGETIQQLQQLIQGQAEIDYLLPAYASVLESVCPCSQRDFETLFNDGFAEYLPVAERKKKTFDNHRTEVSGKLFGMYYYANDGRVYISQRARIYVRVLQKYHTKQSIFL